MSKKQSLTESPIKIKDRFRKARRDNQDAHLDKERQKLGVLRAGSSGIMTAEGQVAGSCLRHSHLRSLGIEIEEITEDKYIMFELGYANEDEIKKQLNATLEPGEFVLAEEEIPISWKTTNGTPVTGRPDLVICREPTPEDDQFSMRMVPGEGNKLRAVVPVLGLELKSVHSMWTAREVLFGGKPKLPNMIQAAHYAWQLGVPYKLIYKSYSQLGQGMVGTDSWASRQFPKMGEPGSEYIEYNEKTGAIKHIRQFEVSYDVAIDRHGRVHYKPEDQTKWTPTIIMIADIQRYFEFASLIEETGNLGPRAVGVDILGNKVNYSADTYSPIKEISDIIDKKYGKGDAPGKYEAWLKLVREHTKNLPGNKE